MYMLKLHYYFMHYAETRPVEKAEPLKVFAHFYCKGKNLPEPLYPTCPAGEPPSFFQKRGFSVKKGLVYTHWRYMYTIKCTLCNVHAKCCVDSSHGFELPCKI